MTKVEALIEEARRLSAPDRLRLLTEVERSLQGDRPTGPPPGSCASLLSHAGTVQSDFSDVSSEKYRHLASAIASDPADE